MRYSYFFIVLLFIVIISQETENKEKVEFTEADIKQLNEAVKLPEVKTEDYQKLAKAFEDLMKSQTGVSPDQQILYGMMGEFFKTKVEVIILLLIF